MHRAGGGSGPGLRVMEGRSQGPRMTRPQAEAVRAPEPTQQSVISISGMGYVLVQGGHEVSGRVSGALPRGQMAPWLPRLVQQGSLQAESEPHLAGALARLREEPQAGKRRLLGGHS